MPGILKLQMIDFDFIAGPCQLESEEHAIKISTELKKITSELEVNLSL